MKNTKIAEWDGKISIIRGCLMINDPALLPSQLNKITSKTLVIAGTRDMVKTNHTRLIARSIRDSKLVFIKGDHFIANNCPDEFNQVIDAFLS